MPVWLQKLTYDKNNIIGLICRYYLHSRLKDMKGQDMYNGCTENTSCKFKSERGTCLLLTSTEEYIDETCPFLSPLEQTKQKVKKKSKKSYELDRFCRIYCKHYIPGVDWNTTRERKGYCSICPLANHVKVE